MYTLNEYARDFYTGQVHDGRQVLMGLLCPELIAYFFSPNGTLLSRDARPWTYPAPRLGEDGPYQLYDSEFRRHLSDQMAGWQQEIGFEPKPISVKKFFDKEHYVGIMALPGPGEDPDWDEDEETLKSWREQGVYEFYWAKDYLMSADGHVKST